MRVSIEWLSEYVDLTGLPPAAIAAALTQAGLEVEEVETTGPRFEGVVLGRIQKVEPHPNADKLRLVTVALSPANAPETLTAKVVCGAPNVREGLLIAFAQEGATVLNRKDGSTFQLTKTAIRGVESAGMICSIDELGLETQFDKKEDGIWPLADVVTTEAGQNALGQGLKEILGLSSNTVLHVAPPANRGDLMSMMGVAREVAALFDRPLRAQQSPNPSPAAQASDLSVTLSDASVCHYYAGAVMRNLKIGPSPSWMAQRLQAAGVRSISNVVDITNYVMLETGQPLHAFDHGKLGVSGTVDVRRARDGETLVTLDDVDRTLTTDSLVITFNDAPVALGGLMGGESTEIDEQSQTLFLEAARFSPVVIRKSAKSVGLRTEGSARFERGVDVEQCHPALLRAITLLQEHAGAELVNIVEAPVQAEATLSQITLRLARVEHVLGLPIDAETITRILEKLAFSPQPDANQPNTLVVTIPSFRRDDITREIDLIEEVARIYGYDKILYTMPQTTGVAPITPRARFVRQIGETLRGQGLQEVMTPSLIGPRLLEKTGGFAFDETLSVSVLNSHSVEHTLMRQALSPGLLEVAQFNQAQGIEDVWIYELGRTYFLRGKPNVKHPGVAEKLRLAGLLTGADGSGRWKGTEAVGFYRVKGMVENLLKALHLEKRVHFKAANDIDGLHPGKTASLTLDDGKTSLGFIGELHPLQQEALKFRQPVYLFELDAEALFKAVSATGGTNNVSRLAPYPSVQRDMALLAPVSLQHSEIIHTLEDLREPLLRDITLFDDYRSAQLGTDKRSLAYRLTFRSDEATLTEADVDQRLSRLKEVLTKQLPVQLR